MLHELKSWPNLFELVTIGAKFHDLRKNDRDFCVGDRVLLREFDPKDQTYSGREILRRITYITSADSPCALSNEGLSDEYCILSLLPIDMDI